MGTIFAWIARAIQFGGPASIGYFFNDAVTWLGSVTGQSTTDPKTGKTKIWIVLAVFLGGGLLIYMLLQFLGGKKGKKGLFILALGVAAQFIDTFFLKSADGVYATLLITLTTGAAVLTPANTTYVPKSFFYAAATQLTGVKITVQGDGVIFDSDANGLTHCGVNRLFGQVTNTYFFRIANGFISNKTVLWEFTNSAAQTPAVYIDSDETPPKDERLYLQLLRQPCIGPGGTDFSDFATLSFPSMAAADYANILYQDGTQQANMNRLDLQALLALTQNVLNTPLYMSDNFGQRIKKVNFQAAATQTAYVQRWVPPVSDGMIEQAIISKG